MSGTHFFVEMNGGQWHRTEGFALKCECGVATSDPRVLKLQRDDDDSWMWAPPSAVGTCFPEHMRSPSPAPSSKRQAIPLVRMESGLDAAIEREVASIVADPAHPTRVAYDRARTAHPEGGDEARAAFYRFLAEGRAEREAAVEAGPRSPTIDKAGAPMCSRTACPKYRRFTGQCAELEAADEAPEVCIPAVHDMALELDARKDSADPAFDEIVKLCGLAKTWEYPGQVVRDVEDALKVRDEKIAQLRAECGQHAMVSMDRVSELRNKLRVAEEVRDAAREQSNRDLEARRLAFDTADVQRIVDVARRVVSRSMHLRTPDRDTFLRNDIEILDKLAKAVGERDACNGAHVFVGDYCRDCGLHAPRVDVDPPRVTRREDGAYTAGSPPDGRSVEAHLNELTTPRADGVVTLIPGYEQFLAPAQSCSCSPKYAELAPGVHASYCDLAGKPLDDGRKRWHCEACKVTFRTAGGETTPIDRCIQCGGLTREMVTRG